jgi:cytochrome oxidase Cu insertion factor (SCO1/SenC/PrrC family)
MQARKILAILPAIAVLLSACSPSSTAGMATGIMPQPAATTMMETSGSVMGTATPEAMMSTPTGGMMQSPSGMMGTATPETTMGTPVGKMMQSPSGMMGTMTPGAMKSVQSSEMGPAPWFGAALTNVSDGQAFTINEFKGQVVLVETMAQWCPTCLSQEKQVKELRMQLGMRNDYVIVGLDIDPNEDAATLKSYAAKNGFDWLFAISPPDTSREIGNLYGAQFLNPPSTPMLIIDRKGDAHSLPFGVKSASDLLQALEPYLSQGM